MIDSKLKKPQKYKLIVKSANYYFDFTGNKHALTVFLQWINKSLPPKAQDVTISIDEGRCCQDSNSYIKLQWKEKTLNIKYAYELKKHKNRHQNDKNI